MERGMCPFSTGEGSGEGLFPPQIFFASTIQNECVLSCFLPLFSLWVPVMSSGDLSLDLNDGAD